MHQAGPHEHPAVDFELLELQVCSLLEDERDFIANAANFAAFLYDALPAINWAGFYFPDTDGLVLGPFGGKPACTRLPSGRGVCGAAFAGAKSVIVDDVNAFADHIVCDSASRSELVVPLLRDNAVYGVFDIDSPVLARFNESDRAGVERLVARFMEYTPVPERYRTPQPRERRINERIDVQTCRDHHVVLRYLADDLSKPDGTPSGKSALLKRFRAVLLAHLKIEDDWLYPRLAVSDNAIVRGKAERYRNDMGGLRAQFEALCKKWSAEAIESDFDGWQNDWRLFAQMLSARIETEDHDLYVAAEADIS
jgi:GAF domain-containing protein